MADDPSDGSEKERNAPTVRDLKGPIVPKDTLPDVVGVYVPPRALPEAAQHRTMDLKSVRLSDYVDARRAPTELRLESPLRSENRRTALWLVPPIVIALGVGAWFFLREPTPSTVVETPVEISPVAPSPAAVMTRAPVDPPAPSAPPTVAEPPTTVPEPAPKAAAEPKVEEKASAPAPSKSQRPRETEKKRKDPWLE